MDLVDFAQDRDANYLAEALRHRPIVVKLAPGEAPAPRDCADCGEDIPVERLRAVPTTVFCAFCQSERE